jgi:hypothetical protein
MHKFIYLHINKYILGKCEVLVMAIKTFGGSESAGTAFVTAIFGSV